LNRSRYEMKVFIPAYFITSGHSVQKWKGKEMNRKNMKKLLFAAIAVVIVAKVVRDTKNAKKQKENIPADTFNDFYEEEAVGSTLNPIGADKEGGTLCRRKQHKK